MTLKVRDRVRQLSDASFAGTGPVLLGTIPSRYRGFVAACGNGAEVIYLIDPGGADTKWEIGVGTLVAGTPDQITRDKVLASSAGAPNKADFDSGAKEIVLVAPANFFPDLAAADEGKMVVVNDDHDGFALKPTFAQGDRAFCPQATAWAGWSIVTGYAQHTIKIYDSAPQQGGTVNFDTVFSTARATQNTNLGDTTDAAAGLSIVSQTTGITHPHTHTQQGTFATDEESQQWSNLTDGITYNYAKRGHTHNVTISGPTGAASAGVSDPGHVHAVDDDGHHHAMGSHSHVININVKFLGTLLVERL